MSVPRIYVAGPLAAGASVELSDQAHWHLVQVLRRRAGEELVLFNGEGGEYRAVLENVGKRSATVRVGEFENANRESPLHVTLAQCVSKGERMDYTIQKAVELGASEIIPLISERSVVRLSNERWERKQEHWQGIVVSACEQSGRTHLPPIRPVADLCDWLPSSGAEAVKLLLAPGAEAAVTRLEASRRPVVLLVGPEGGLSEVEIKLAELAGFQSLQLGPRVLRTETAGVVALSVVQALWGDLAALT